jgi:membrane protease YdiL (CAAX protease family)
MDSRNRSGQELLTFLVLTFGLSSIFYYSIISAGSLELAGAGAILGLMWCPAAGALVTRLLFHHSLRGLGWGLGKPRFLLASYLVPSLYALVAYGLVWIAARGALFDASATEQIAERLSTRWGWSFGSDLATLSVFFLLVATRGVFFNVVFALGEEIGWRGLLVPRLAEITSFTNTSWISGLVWGIWHWPLILLADFHGPSVAFSLIIFTLLTVAMSFIYAWLRLRSGSLWTAVLLHGSHNAFIQGFFDRVATQTHYSEYLTGEFGLVTVAVVSVVAWLFWRRRGEVQQA